MGSFGGGGGVVVESIKKKKMKVFQNPVLKNKN